MTKAGERKLLLPAFFKIKNMVTKYFLFCRSLCYNDHSAKIQSAELYNDLR